MEQNNEYTNHHGIFICYKRSHSYLAGRVYDFFKYKGLDPFMDEQNMHRTNNFPEMLKNEIISTPYFLCILTEDGLADLLSESYAENVYFKEIKTALDSGRDIIILREEVVTYEKFRDIPDEDVREGLKVIHSNIISDNNEAFTHVLELIYQSIDLAKLKGVINWREYTQLNSNVLLLQRNELQDTTATLENRFGAEFVQCVRDRKEFTGQYIIKEINMACYSANMIFTADRDMLDRNSYDLGMMFRIFANLLKDPDFNLRMVLNAPGSFAAQDAVDYRKLGNSSFEEYPEAVFLSSFSNIHKLMGIEPYSSASQQRRFSLILTECCLPYAIFHVVYKKGWEELNHVKIDLYSINIDSSEERRSMLIFEKDNKADYDFFVNQFVYLRQSSFQKRSRKLIRENEDRWLQEWEDLKKELRGED